MNPVLDRSSPHILTQSSMSKIISDFMLQNNITDPWRYYNPQTRIYYFFSKVHQSYSRTDYFFSDKSLITKVTSSEYHSIVISDHAPLTLGIKFSNFPNFTSSWKFNTPLLSDDAFIIVIRSSIHNFLTVNKMILFLIPYYGNPSKLICVVKLFLFLLIRINVVKPGCMNC